MAASKKEKRAIVFLSSSSEGEEESETDGSEEDYDEDGEEESPSEDGSRSTTDDDDEDDDEDDDDDDDALKGKPNDEELCDKVIDLLRKRRSLSTLKLDECKSYLRKHELRLSGTKATCMERILEHWRIKDGNGEKLYPRESFVINCTGDICRGDVILFKQRVYDKFDKVKRGGNVIGKRIIAGRVVKESYGAAKQQHTFTVEVLWSKGVKALPPLFALLVKGRNIYRLKPFRQRWRNEVERSKVLDEKHKRGAAARHVRAIAKAKSANRGSKNHLDTSTARAPPSKRRKRDSETSIKKKPNSSTCSKAPTSNGRTEWMRVPDIRPPEPSMNPPRHTSYHGHGINTYPTLHQRVPPYVPYYNQRELDLRSRNMLHPPLYNPGFSSHEFYMGHPYVNPPPQFYPRSSSHMLSTAHFNHGGPEGPSGEQFYRWWA